MGTPTRAHRTFLALVALGWLAATSAGAAPLARVDDSVARSVEAGGATRVLIELAVPVRPEGELGSASEVQLQRNAIESAQRALLDRLRWRHGTTGRRFRTLPLLAVELDAGGIEAARAEPGVVAVHADRLAAPLLAESTALIDADDAWAQAAEGAGQVVAVLDTGVDSSHPFLANRVVGEACYSTTFAPLGSQTLCPNGQPDQQGTGSAAPCAGADCGHGTHVAGIAAGNGSTSDGVARSADLFAIQVFSRFTGSTCTDVGRPSPCVLSFLSDQISALEHVFERRNELPVAAVNMSLGSGGFAFACDSDPLKPAIDNLRSVGIATIVAAGNEGFAGAISAPACISTAISVGSTTKADGVSSFSNGGNLLDLWAPGSLIRSSVPGGGFSFFSGTSMAAPHVAGAFALLRSSAPSASVAQILNALTTSGVPIFDSRNGLTRARIDLDDALAAVTPVGGALAVTPSDGFSSAGPQGGPFSPEAKSWTLTNVGTSAIQVAISEDAAWASVDKAAVSLAPGASEIVSLLVGAGAAAEAVGTAQAQLSFSNQTNAQGNASRPLALVVSAPTVVNDKFAEALALSTSSGSTVSANLNATKEPGEPNHASRAGGASLWWHWTGPANGELVVETTGSSFDTLLGVYTGTTLGSLVEVAANDDSGGALQSRVEFDVVPGATYRIAVDGFNGQQGDVVLAWTFTPSATTPGDLSVSPAAGFFPVGPETGPFAPDQLDYSLTNIGATPQEFQVTGLPAWVVADPSQGTLSPGASATVTLSLGAGAAALPPGRHAGVARFNTVERGIELEVTGSSASNDDFASATALVGVPAAASGSNVGAGKETGEPDHGGVPGSASVWWRWTAPADATISVDTFGSGFDTTLGVYSGASVDALATVAANDDAAGGLLSQVLFPAIAGTTYHIAVDGYQGESGAIALQLAVVPGGSPANDDLAMATPLAGASATAQGTTLNATKEVGEPAHAGDSGGHSAWWRWTAPASGTVPIDTFGSGFDTTLAVYTGSDVGALTPIAANDDTGTGLQSRVVLLAQAGVAYAIAVDGFAGASGSVVLNVGQAGTPVLSSPAPGGTLDAPAAVFRWQDQGLGVTDWWLYVGSSPGGSDLHDSGNLGAATQRIVSGLPVDGRALHVTLWYRVGTSSWQTVRSQLTAWTAPPPEISSPVPGSSFGSGAATFVWTDHGRGVGEWWLYVGSSPGGSDLHDSGNLGGASQSNVTGLPVDGRTLHVTLFYRSGGSSWQRLLATYTAADIPVSDPEISGPVPGSTLGSSQALFEWNDGGSGVGEWWLYVGSSPGGSDLHDSGNLGGASQSNVTGLPVDGRTLHVTLFYRSGGGSWQRLLATYTAADIPVSDPEISGPVPGSALGSSQALFEWNDGGSGVGEWWLYVGSSPGGSDLHDSGNLGGASQSNVTGLPVDGRTLHVTLFYRSGGGSWQRISVTYVAFTAASPGVTSPAPSSELAGSSVSFAWETGGTPVEAWWLYVGSSVGGRDLHDSGNLGSTTTYKVSTLPVDGRDLYLTLWYRTGGVWTSRSFTYQAALVPPPTNDDFADALVLVGLPASAAGSNEGASKEAGEPAHADDPGGHSVWWQWTATSSGPMMVEGFGDAFGASVAVYEGSGLQSLVSVGQNRGTGALAERAAFEARMGTTYYIAVDGFGGGAGGLTLELSARPTLLVVDDDANVPDVRDTYTGALDALGIAYEIYDTTDGSEPATDRLTHYERVFWFTGNDASAQTGPGAAGEAALAGYAESGGCLIVSSQDYTTARGVTPFVRRYLGVRAAAADIAYLRVRGLGRFSPNLATPLELPFENRADDLFVNPFSVPSYLGEDAVLDTWMAGSFARHGDYRAFLLAFPLLGVGPPKVLEPTLASLLDACTPRTLLVDDAPNADTEHARNVQALEDVGADYDTWSVATAGEPEAEDLTAYDHVLWYTFDDESTATGPSLAAEAAITEFLGSGGCFALTSADYLFARGLTDFGADFLAIDPSSAQDVGHSAVWGATNGPMARMGRRNLAPRATSGFRDAPVANILGGRLLDGNYSPAAIYQAPIYYPNKTTFWGNGIEELQSANDRRELMDRLLNGYCDGPAAGLDPDTSETATPRLEWHANGKPVTEWWLYVGTTPGANDLHDSGSLGPSATHASLSLPRNTVYFTRLFFRIGGSWRSLDGVWLTPP